MPGILAPNCQQANIWIEGENNPAQWGGLDGKKTSGHRESVSFLPPFMEITKHCYAITSRADFNQTTDETKKLRGGCGLGLSHL
jgi:hypothetical protein